MQTIKNKRKDKPESDACDLKGLTYVCHLCVSHLISIIKTHISKWSIKVLINIHKNGQSN